MCLNMCFAFFRVHFLWLFLLLKRPVDAQQQLRVELVRGLEGLHSAVAGLEPHGATQAGALAVERAAAGRDVEGVCG